MRHAEPLCAAGHPPLSAVHACIHLYVAALPEQITVHHAHQLLVSLQRTADPKLQLKTMLDDTHAPHPVPVAQATLPEQVVAHD
jgi:hypothetical protein